MDIQGSKEMGGRDDFDHFQPLCPNMDRRAFLKFVPVLAPALWHCQASSQGVGDFWSLPRELWLQRRDSGEEVRTVYWQDGALIPQEYDRICRLLRDVRANKAVQMDPVLLDVLCGAQGWFKANGFDVPLLVNSGYRTMATNAATEGASKDSQHMRGKACDWRVSGVPADYLGKVAIYLAGGGVGIYSGMRFVHTDTGRIRVWNDPRIPSNTRKT
jgi:uncharacterized protein YcbK (DUF882 family)